MVFIAWGFNPNVGSTNHCALKGRRQVNGRNDDQGRNNEMTRDFMNNAGYKGSSVKNQTMNGAANKGLKSRLMGQLSHELYCKREHYPFLNKNLSKQELISSKLLIVQNNQL